MPPSSSGPQWQTHRRHHVFVTFIEESLPLKALSHYRLVASFSPAPLWSLLCQQQGTAHVPRVAVPAASRACTVCCSWNVLEGGCRGGGAAGASSNCMVSRVWLTSLFFCRMFDTFTCLASRLVHHSMAQWLESRFCRVCRLLGWPSCHTGPRKRKEKIEKKQLR